MKRPPVELAGSGGPRQRYSLASIVHEGGMDVNATISPLTVDTGSTLVTRIDYHDTKDVAANIVHPSSGRSLTVHGREQVVKLRDALDLILSEEGTTR